MSNLNSLSKRRLSGLKFQLDECEQQFKTTIVDKAKYLKYMNYKDGINSFIGITGQANGLMNHWDSFDPEQLKEYIFAIARSSDRIVNLVSNMLDLAYISYKDFNLNLGLLNLKPWLKQKFSKYNSNVNVKDQIKFISEIDNDTIFNCDKYLINRLFDNLTLCLFDTCKINYVKVELVKLVSSYLEDKSYVQVIINYKQINPASINLDKFWHNKHEYINDDNKIFEFEFNEYAGLILACKIIELHQGKIRTENSIEGTKNIIFTLLC